MISVMLVTPEEITEISVRQTAIQSIRALAKTWADTSEYCEIALPNEYHTNVPRAAIDQITRMHAVGAI